MEGFELLSFTGVVMMQCQLQGVGTEQEETYLTVQNSIIFSNVVNPLHRQLQQTPLQLIPAVRNNATFTTLPHIIKFS